MLPVRPPSTLADLDPESPSYAAGGLGAPPMHAPPLQGSYANPLFSAPGGPPPGQVPPSRLPPPPPGRVPAGPMRPPFVPAVPSSRLPAPGFMAGGVPPLKTLSASWQPMAPGNVSRTASAASDAVGAMLSPTYQQHVPEQNAVPSSFSAPAAQQPEMTGPWDVPLPPPPRQQQQEQAAADNFEGAPYAWGNGGEAGDNLVTATEYGAQDYNAQQEAPPMPPASWGQVPVVQHAPGLGGGFLASKKLPPPATSLQSPLKARYAKGAPGKQRLPLPPVRTSHFGAQHNFQGSMHASVPVSAPPQIMGGGGGYGGYDGSSVASAPAPDASDVEVNQYTDEQPIPAENEFPGPGLGNSLPPPPPTMAPGSFPTFVMQGVARTESGGSRSASGGFDRAAGPPPMMGPPSGGVGGLMKMGSGSMLPAQQPRGSFDGHGTAPAMFNPSMAGMPETPSSPAASRLAPPPQLAQPQSKAQKQRGETRQRKKRRGFCTRLFILTLISLILGVFISAGSTVVAITVAANLTHAAVAGVRRLPGSTSLSDAMGSWGPALDGAVAHVSGVSQSEWFRVLESFECDDLKPSCRATQWMAHKARVGASLGREAIHLVVSHAPHAWEGAVLPAANFTRSQSELLWSQMKGLRSDEGRAAVVAAVHHSIADARKLGEDSLGWGHCVYQHISTSGIKSLDQVAAACWTEWMGHYYLQNAGVIIGPARQKQDDGVEKTVVEEEDVSEVPSSEETEKEQGQEQEKEKEQVVEEEIPFEEETPSSVPPSNSTDTEEQHIQEGDDKLADVWETLDAVMPSPSPAPVDSKSIEEIQPDVIVEEKDEVAVDTEEVEETQDIVPSSPVVPVEEEEYLSLDELLLDLPVEKEVKEEKLPAEIEPQQEEQQQEQPNSAPSNDTEVLEANKEELPTEVEVEIEDRLPVEEVLAPSPPATPHPVVDEMPPAAVEVEDEGEDEQPSPELLQQPEVVVEEVYAYDEVPPSPVAVVEIETEEVPMEKIIKEGEAVVVIPEEAFEEPAELVSEEPAPAPATVAVEAVKEAVEEPGPSASEKLAEQAAVLKGKLNEVSSSAIRSLRQQLSTLKEAASNAAAHSHAFIKANATIVTAGVAIAATTAAFLIGNATAQRAAAAGIVTPRRPSRASREDEDPGTAYKSAQSGGVFGSIFGSGQKSTGEVVNQGEEAAPAAAAPKRRGRQSAPARLAPLDDDAGEEEEEAPTGSNGRRGAKQAGSGEAPAAAAATSSRGRSRSRGPAASTKTARARKVTAADIEEEVPAARSTRKASTSRRSSKV